MPPTSRCAAGPGAALLLAVAAGSLLDPLPPPASAGWNPQARLAIDVQTHVSKRTCESLRDHYPTCDSIRTTLEAEGEFDAVIVLHNFSAITAAVFTIAWPADWEIYGFESCGDALISDESSPNALGAAVAWGSPVRSHGGGRPIGILRGRATSPGCIRILSPWESLPAYQPELVDADFHGDALAAWSDGCVAMAWPDDPCAFGSPELAARFSATPSGGPAPPLTVQFADESLGEPTAWFWDFGDGDTSLAQHPAHTYPACGRYTVSLQVENAAARDDTFRLNYIRVNEPLVANFTAGPNSGCAPLGVQLTDTSTGSPDSWRWSFGDGAQSTERNPFHVYEEPGTYIVSLRVTARCADEPQTSTALVIASGPPRFASFTASHHDGCPPLEVQFTSTSDWPALFWLWDFGDGTTSAEENPQHTYSERGAYDVKLTAWNGCGAAETTAVACVRTDRPRSPSFSSGCGSIWVQPPCPSQPTTFWGEASDPVDEWRWDFGDGGTSAGENPLHTFAAAGIYQVTLTILAPCGEASWGEPVIVGDPWDCCRSVATQLQGPQAEPRETGILVRWVVTPPSDYVGYHVLRAERAVGPFVRVNPALLPDLTAGGTHTHEFLDESATPGVPYYYRLEAVLADGTSSTFAVPYTVTLPAREGSFPTVWFGSPRPVPSRGLVEVELGLPPGSTALDLAVYDPRGRRVRTLASGALEGGLHLLRWDGEDETGRPAPAGIYFLRCEAGGKSWTKKLLLMR